MKNRIGKLKISVFFLWVMFFSAIGILLHMEMIFGQKKAFFGSEMHLPKISAAVVSSGSMSPVLDVGDLVFVIESDTYEPGDIVEISGKDGTHILHRLLIYNTYADIALTRGDANTMADDPVRCSEIQGKLWFSLPYAGAVVHFFKGHSGHLIMTLLSLLLFLSLLVTALKRKIKSNACSVFVPSSESEPVCEIMPEKKNPTGKIKIIGILTAVLLVLMMMASSFSRISASYRSGRSGDFSLQAGASPEEEETTGIDVVYWQLD